MKLEAVLPRLDPDQLEALVAEAVAALEKLRAELADGSRDPLEAESSRPTVSSALKRA